MNDKYSDLELAVIKNINEETYFKKEVRNCLPHVQKAIYEAYWKSRLD